VCYVMLQAATLVCCSVLQCVAVCCGVLQCVAGCNISSTHASRVAACCRVLPGVAACCRVLQCVAVCCIVMQCVAVCCHELMGASRVKTHP